MKLIEFYTFGGRKEFSGANSGLKRPIDKRNDDFPYDRQQTYGTPQAYDRGSNYGRDGGDHVLIPKDTEHTQFDGDEPSEPVEEATGFPISIEKSNMGDSYGQTIPGTSGKWANSPFDTEISDNELEKAADEDSVWKVAEAFVSLRTTPADQMQSSITVKDAELEILIGDFKKTSEEYLSYLNDLENDELIKSLLDLDYDYAVSNFAQKIDRNNLMNTYKGWTDAVLVPPTDQEIDHEDQLK